MSNATQVALALRTLHPEDRAWMFSQLTTTEKETIRDVIGQPDIVLPLSQRFELAIAREERNALPESTIVARLNSLDPFQIAYALESEPDWVLALIFDAHHWPWHHQVLDRLGLARKGQIARISYSPLPHRLIESLLNALYEHARAIPTRSHPAPIKSSKADSRWLLIQRKLRGVMAWAR